LDVLFEYLKLHGTTNSKVVLLVDSSDRMLNRVVRSESLEILRDSWRAPERENRSPLGELLSGIPEGHWVECSGESCSPWGPHWEM
jgi:hypothetical protein